MAEPSARGELSAGLLRRSQGEDPRRGLRGKAVYIAPGVTADGLRLSLPGSTLRAAGGSRSSDVALIIKGRKNAQGQVDVQLWLALVPANRLVRVLEMKLRPAPACPVSGQSHR